MTMPPDQGYEYVADSQWAGWWGGYGAEHLLGREMNERAAEGWRLHDVDVKTFLWFGVTIWPPALPFWLSDGRSGRRSCTSLNDRFSERGARRASPRSEPALPAARV